MIKCAYAQSGIFISSQGFAAPCCEYKNHKHPMGHLTDESGTAYNINSHSLEEIHQSPILQDLRHQLRQGQKPIGCNGCWTREEAGMESRRTLAQSKLSNIYEDVDWDKGNLLFSGVFLGNVCNLGCRICNPELSSVLATEHKQLEFNEKAGWVRQDQFWDNFKKTTSIKNYEILGGEPLYQKNFLNFMDHLVESGRSQDCIVDIITNGTIYPRIAEQADKFNRLTFNISIDNVGDKFELERHGASWNKVNENISRMIEQKETHDNLFIRSTTAVNIQNVLDLPELYQYFIDQNFDSYWFGLVYQPQWLSIGSLTKEAKELVLSKLERHQDIDQLGGIIDIIKNSTVSDGREFVEQTKIIDQRRGQDFRKTHPDIAKAMGYV